jgi:hypothetical protein
MIHVKMGSGLVLVVTGLLLVAAMIGSSRADPATISLDPASVSALGVGETFTVNVMIADVTDLYGWQINVTFSPSVLSVESVAEGPFLASVNETTGLQRSIDNSAGYVLASSSFKPPYEAIPDGASGSGQLASITFSVKAGGGSDLRFDEERTYLRTFVPGGVQPIGDVVRQDGSYGGGGGGGGGFAGLPWEIIGAAVAVVVVVAVVGVFLLRRRRAEAEGEEELVR